MPLYGHMPSFILGKLLGVEWLNHMVGVSVCVWEREIYFKKLTHMIGGAGKFKIHTGLASRLEPQTRVDVAVLSLKSIGQVSRLETQVGFLFLSWHRIPSCPRNLRFFLFWKLQLIGCGPPTIQREISVNWLWMLITLRLHSTSTATPRLVFDQISGHKA